MKKEHDIRIERELLHPWLNYKLTLLLNKCAKKDIYLIITEGFRTKKYQDELYAKGRTEKGNIVTNAKGSVYASQHQWGIAFDIAVNDSKLLYDSEMIKKVSKIAKKIGLGWGGDWNSPVDYPHFYLPKWGDTTTVLKRMYTTPDKFKRSWTRTVTGSKNGVRLFNKTRTKVLLKGIKNGTKMKVMYEKSWYAKVSYKNKVGYIKKKYLK